MNVRQKRIKKTDPPNPGHEAAHIVQNLHGAEDLQNHGPVAGRRQHVPAENGAEAPGTDTWRASPKPPRKQRSQGNIH